MPFNPNIYSEGSRHQFKERGEDLTIKHVPTGEMVVFPAFIDLFSDNFSSQWNAEDVYGRMDPISTFMNTKRSLSVAWWVPADSFEHAEENLAKANKLMSFLYPLYDNPGKGSGGATVINQGPLMRVSFGNLIRNAKTGRGLLGYVNGFTFDPAVEYGMFNRRGAFSSELEPDSKGRTRNPQWNEYYPKTYRLNFEFTVLHEHELGYRQVGKEGNKFAYNSGRINELTFPYSTERSDEGKLASTKTRIKNRDPDGLYRDKETGELTGFKKTDPNSPAEADASRILGNKKD
tara:strand:- start:7835 stop:8704 length:870 start_codon:yes stop_codon:yes gene_type:complete